MKIEVAIKDGDSPKQRGDLLEGLAKKLLEAQNYEVETEIRNTGMELDLLCKHKANNSKQIYVECKAYKESNKIQADVIKNIVGIKNIKNYTEVWLISTSEFGKDAKGLKDEIESGNQAKDYTFYTPEKLIQALQTSNTAINVGIAKNRIEETLGSNKVGNSTLIITEYGYFYLFEYLKDGVTKDVFVTYANNGNIVDEEKLLVNLKNTDTSYKDFQFKSNLQLFPSHANIINSPTVLLDNKFKINESYANKLDDTGIKFTHANKSELILSDIFVYQDLQDIEDNKKIKINAEKLLDIAQYPKCIIFGEEVSGKTALICTLQKELNAIELLPIFIDAKDIKSSDLNKFEQQLSKNFTKQYAELGNDTLRNHYKKIVILIDNYESLAIKKFEFKSKFLEMINQNFNNVLIFSDDSTEMEIMTKRS
ncbi:MAG: restriction endonuclease [Sulfurovum sp.]